MRGLKRSIIGIALALSFAVSSLSNIKVYADDVNELTKEQSNAIEMLNYITVLTQDINASKNSRVYMEKAYSMLINNTYPNSVDSRTLSQMTGLLDTMEKYRMVDVKRERLQYVYEQSQAEAIKAAIPNPMGLLSAVHSFDPVKLVASVVYMGVDSAASYKAYTTEIEKQYLKDGWALDDEEASVLHESRKGTFSYMVKMVNDYDLPGDLTLTQDTVEELVKWKNDSNIVGRIRFLESNKRTYQSYGGYWLILAESYYQNEDYKKCLEAITTYEGLGTRIFRRDYELAKTLPLAIAAAKNTYKKDEYAAYASERAQVIVNNTDHDDWALRYFAAQTLVDIYAETKDKSYLDKAYDIVVDNVNYLMAEQKSQNEEYLSPVKEKTALKSASKTEKDEIKKYNKMLKDSRKKEMPPVYEPLMLNCDLLFALADEMKLPSNKKSQIDKMLHPGGSALFLVSSVDNDYWFSNPNKTTATETDMTVEMSKETITLPAAYLTGDSTIKVTVKENGATTSTEFTDWTVDEVKREKEDDISTFTVTYESKTAKKYSWKEGDTVTVDVVCREGKETAYHFEFKTTGTKDAWYKYAKVWESDILFERTK